MLGDLTGYCRPSAAVQKSTALGGALTYEVIMR